MLLYVLVVASPPIVAPVASPPALSVGVPAVGRGVSLLSRAPVPVLFVLVLAILAWLALGTRAKQSSWDQS
eukprot:13241434-Ditylum_brightwellii.AAC.1